MSRQLMRKFVVVAVALVVVVGAIALPASAAITAFFVPVAGAGTPYPPAALADQPSLANMQTWDLRVTTDGNWASAGMRVVLSPGATFFKHPFGGSTKPPPALFTVAPALEFTTYVTAPADTGNAGAPAVLGGFPEGEPESLGNAGSAIPGTFSMSWGDLVVDAPGTYQIARFTFPVGSQFDILDIFDTGPTGNYSKTSQVNPDSSVPIVIPEPGSAIGLVVASLLIGVRRRRQ